MTPAARSPPAAPIPTAPLPIPPSAQSQANPRVVTISAAGEIGANEADPGTPSRPVLSRSGLDPRIAKALPRTMTTLPN